MYYPDNGVCTEVDSQCNGYDETNGHCTGCYHGFTLTDDGKCLADDGSSNPPAGENPDENCKIWDCDAHRCLECHDGFAPQEDGTCGEQSAPGGEEPDASCHKWEGDVCTECSHRYEMIEGECVRVSDYCKEWDSNAECTACYDGYRVENGECVLDENSAPPAGGDGFEEKDGCHSHDEAGNCLQCSFRYWMDEEGNCHQVDDQCESWNLENGHCTGCYHHYTLDEVEGKCHRDEQDPPAAGEGEVPDGCHSYDFENAQCMECSFRYYWHSDDQECKRVSDQCREWNLEGKCTDCYHGYELVDGECIAQEGQPPAGGDGSCTVSDPYCHSWDCETGVCEQCSQRAVFIDGDCTPVDDHCKDWNLAGDCTECYQGYTEENGDCVIDNSPPAGGEDDSCRCHETHCQQCEARHVPIDGECVKVSDRCETWNMDADCTSCYDGDSLNDEGECVPNPPSGNDGCKTRDDSGECLECEMRHVYNCETGNCEAVSDTCATWNAHGQCESCVEDTELTEEGECLPPPSGEPEEDPNCVETDADGHCVRCNNEDPAKMRIIDGRCEDVSNCNAWNEDNSCSSCSWKNVLIGKTCTKVDDQCKTWYEAHEAHPAKCESCYAGYHVNENHDCVQS